MSHVEDSEKLLAKILKFSSEFLQQGGVPNAIPFLLERLPSILPSHQIFLIDLKHFQFHSKEGTDQKAQSSFLESLRFLKNAYSKQPIVLNHNSQGLPQGLINQLQSKGHTSVLWLPLTIDSVPTPPRFALWLERVNGQTFLDSDLTLSKHLLPFLYKGLDPSRKKTLFFKKSKVLFFFILLLFFIPWPETIVAPAQVQALKSKRIFAPLEGIIAHLHVEPGQPVQHGDLLFEYDTQLMEKSLEEAKRKVEVGRAEVIRLEGESFHDPKARAQLPIQELAIKAALIEQQTLLELKAKAQVTSPLTGVVLIDRPESIEGTLVQPGEWILSVAEPGQTNCRIAIPVSQSGHIFKGQPLKVQLDHLPFESFQANIHQKNLEVVITNQQFPSVDALATWKSKMPQSVLPGVRGQAKISIGWTFLGWQLFKGPLLRLQLALGL